MDFAQSYSIGQDMEYGAHRRRSNTAQRLERLKRERKNLEKIKIVHWRDHKEATQLTRTYYEVIIYCGDLLEPDVTGNHFSGSTGTFRHFFT